MNLSRRERERERERLIKEKNKYDKSVMKAKQILDKNVPFDNLKVKEMHLVLAPLKRKGDKWPTKRHDLIALYPQVKDRAPLEFEIDLISKYDDENANQLNDDSNIGTNNEDDIISDFAMI